MSNWIPQDDGHWQDSDSDDSEGRICWICYTTDEENPASEWVKPCNCCGTSKWVHQSCIQEWYFGKRRDNPERPVACPLCRSIYAVEYPDMSFVASAIDVTEKTVKNISHAMALIIVICSVICVLAMGGFLIVLQGSGINDALEIFRGYLGNVITLLAIIPSTLYLSKKIHWEEVLLMFLRRHSCKIPVLRKFLPGRSIHGWSIDMIEYPSLVRLIDYPIFGEVFYLPIAGLLLGQSMFFVETNIMKAVLAGITITLIRGILKMYVMQKFFLQGENCRILNRATISSRN